MHSSKSFRRLFAFAVMLVAMAAAAPSQPVQAKRVNMSQTARVARDVFWEVNRRRAAAGKPELEIDETLNAIAVEHSSRMATHKVAFGHSGFDNRFKLVKKQWGPARSFAENVAKDPTGVATVDMWWASAGHKKNILGDYTHTGIGVVRGNDGNYYFTQVFVKK